MKSTFTLLFSCNLLVFQFAVTQTTAPYRHAKLSVEKRTADLLQRMTTEEKVGQLQCWIASLGPKDSVVTTGVGSLAVTLRPLSAKAAAERANQLQHLAVEKTRLGIPLLIHDEALHGLIGKGATNFPQAIALAATWEPDLMGRIATVIGRQTKSRGIRQVLSPVVNVVRDARWGRVEETYGEDPYLSERMGVAFCKPIESQGVVTTPKHFVANVGDGGRDSHAIEVSETQLREIYLPPFLACFREAGSRSVMASYNSVNGLPASSNHWLLTDLLRGEWGFQGFVVSDYGSVSGIESSHMAVANASEGAERALSAGLDVELPQAYFYGKPLLQAIKDKRVSMAVLDTAVARVLKAKFQLGLFDNPYVDPNEADNMDDTNEDRMLGLEAGRKSIVLLRNENGLLPLKKDLKTIAVLGPAANTAHLGGYSGFGMKTVNMLEGIRNKVSAKTNVVYAQGIDQPNSSLPAISPEYLIPAGAKPDEHGLRGEYFSNMNFSGKPKLARVDEKIDFDWGSGPPDTSLPADRFSVRWTGTLVPPVSRTYRLCVMTDDGVRVWLDGKLIDDNWHDRGATADYMTLKLEAGRHYDLKIDFYENGGESFASLGWDLSMNSDRQLQEAVDAARGADVAVVVTSIVEGEGRDRADLDLPGRQEELIKTVAATGVPVVVVLVNGSPVTMQRWIGDVAGIVESWYGGEEAGNALAEVLFGDENPGGKLPITFPQFVGQCPIYYNLKPSGRGYDYVDMSGEPLYPFGFGLSYTKFEYSNLRIDPGTMGKMGRVEVNVDVRNIGTRTGDEVVQLYLHDPVATVVRPLKELKGFKRIMLAPGEKKTVSFALSSRELSFLNAAMQLVTEPGEIEVMVGSSSEDIRVRSKFTIKE